MAKITLASLRKLLDLTIKGVGVFSQSAITDDLIMLTPIYFIKVDASGKDILVTLPDPAIYYTKPITIKRVDDSSNSVTVANASGELIEDQASEKLFPRESITVMSDRANYHII